MFFAVSESTGRFDTRYIEKKARSGLKRIPAILMRFRPDLEHWLHAHGFLVQVKWPEFPSTVAAPAHKFDPGKELGRSGGGWPLRR